MMKFTRISRDLLIFIGASLMIIFIVFFFYYRHTYKEVLNTSEQKTIKHINGEVSAMNSFQAQALDMLSENINTRAKSYMEEIALSLQRDSTPVQEKSLNRVSQELDIDLNLYDIYVLNSNGVIVNTTNREHYMENLANLQFLNKERFLEVISNNEVFVKDFHVEASSSRLRKLAFRTTMSGNHVIMLRIYSNNATQIKDFISNRLDEIAEANTGIEQVNIYINPEAPQLLNSLNQPEIDKITMVKNIFQKESKNFEYNIPGNENLLSNYTFHNISSGDMFNKYVVEIVRDTTTVSNKLVESSWNVFLIGLSVIIVILVIAMYLLRKRINIPVSNITGSLNNLANADFSDKNRLTIRVSNEFQEQAVAITSIIEQFNIFLDHIKRLSTGDTSMEVKSGKENKMLSNAVMKLRDNIKALQEEKQERTKEDENTRWMNDGLQKFTEITRQSGDNITKLFGDVLRNLVPYVNVQQGAMYFAKTDTDNSIFLEQEATFAYDRLITVKNTFGLKEGFVGICASEKNTIYRTEIPAEYIEITTGLGGTPPRSILFVPVISENTVLAVIELSSIYTLADYQIDFVERIAKTVSYSILTANNNERNRKLLADFEEQSKSFKEREKQLNEEIEQLKTNNNEKDTRINELMKSVNSLNEKLSKARKKIKDMGKKH